MSIVDNMSPEELMLISAAAVIIISKKKKRKKPRWWVRKYLQNKENVFSDLRVVDGSFTNFTRMNKTDFEILLQKIEPIISKKDTKLRNATRASLRLAVTLRYLTTGNSYTSLSYTFKISRQLISKIVPEVCRALIHSLKGYIRIPSNEEEWKEVAKKFYTLWNFPHCVGAIDGKHVLIIAPPNSGSDYYNYKEQFSIVLLAIVDAQYNFMYANIGAKGKSSDGGLFRETVFYKKMIDKALSLPPAEILQSTTVQLPYVLVGDSAFALSENLMRPYPGTYEKGNKKRIFNYRLSRARRIVENVFGVMSVVFRIFRSPIESNNAELVTTTCVYLHNFLSRNKRSRALYIPPGTYDREDSELNVINGSWRNEVTGNNLHPLEEESENVDMARVPSTIRDIFANYFNSEQGRVFWQNERA